MPTYEYGCEACGHEFEKEQRITEDPIKKCPKCGKQKARRLITQGNFILKGGGWYADLYSSTDRSTPKKPDGAGGAGGGSLESKSSEGKAADSKSAGEGGGKSTDGGAGPSKEPAKKSEGTAKSTKKASSS